MDNEAIKREFHRLEAGALMPCAFADHVRSHPERSVAECLGDPLPVEINTIKVPETYDLEGRYRRTRSTQPDLPADPPPTSFEMRATTWKDLAGATAWFEEVSSDFDIYPSGVLIDGDTALVICNT